MDNKIDLRTIQLLASRMCHDLVGPVGAINAAVELLGDEDGALDAEALKMLAKSAGEANSKLAFFRAVFGLGGSKDQPDQVAQLVELANGVLASGKVKVRWDPDMPATLPGGAGKVVMLLVYLAAEALPRGGEVGVRVQDFSDGLGVACVAEGEGAALREEINDVLKGAAPPEELTARGIPAYLLVLLANNINAKVEFSADQPDQIALAALLSD